MDKDSFKTPPNMVNSNHVKQGNPKNDSNKILMSSQPTSLSQSPSLSPSQNSAATAPKRIINKIPLDFSKLKQAGLDRKLAEVLSKQNLSPATKIASASATATSSSASASASASYAAASAVQLSTEATTTKQAQRQHQRPTAAPPIRKKTAPNLVAVNQQSLHVKAIIKNKILNKMAKSPVPPATTTTTTNNLPSSGFTVPIAKADLTARPKLLLNSVNQLPKHRAMCGVSSSSQPRRSQPQESPPQAKPRQLSASPSPSPTSSTLQPKSKQQQTKPATHNKPLIVLENKVLAPNEKIDLRALRLPKMPGTMLEPTKILTLPEPAKEIPQSPKEKAKNTAHILQMPPTTPSSSGKKFILNANKLKVPREQLAQMAKNIREQAMHKSPPVATKATEEMQIDTPQTLLVTPNSKETSVQSLITPVVVEAVAKPQSESTIVTPNSCSTAAPTEVISAVDFIAQLKFNNSLDMSNYTDLSAEELSMNALFNDCHTAIPTSETPQVEQDTQEELPIGKILQMEEMDILHATMNVDENETNVLCISPNAIKLQKSMQTEAAQADKKDNSLEIAIKTTSLETSSSKNNLNLPKTPTLQVTAPQEVEKAKTPQQESQIKVTADQEAEKAKTSQQESQETEKSKIAQVETQVKVTEPQEMQKTVTPKQENQVNEVKRPTFRPKKGKINLVQRNKKNSVAKPNKIEQTELKITEKQSETFNSAENVVEIQENNTNSIDKELNGNKEILETELNNENNISKEDKVLEEHNNKIRKENIAIQEEIQEKVDKKQNKLDDIEEERTETAIKKRKTNLDSEINKDNKVNEANISNFNKKQKILNTELNKQTVNNELNEEIVQKECINNLVNNIGSEVNSDKQINKENNTKVLEVQPEIAIEHEKNINEKEMEKQNNLNINEKEMKEIGISEANSVELETSLNEQELAAKETDLEIRTTEESKQSIEVPSNSTKERDLTQLYHPPKMPKLKQKLKPNNEDNSTELQSSVSLLEVLSQEDPPPQGEPQLPFRSDANKETSTEKKPIEVVGIQNLICKLTAENVMPASQENKETKVEEPAKVPRKKLVKTRPVLSGKRAAKSVSPKTEALHPRKRALLTTESHRVPTSSTSDDDVDSIHKFNSEATGRKSATNSKHNETDISDDATPDYDETEEEKVTQKKQTKTEEKIETIETIPEQIDKAKVNETESETAKAAVAEQHILSVTLEPMVVKKKRGRPFKKVAPNATENDTNKTEVPEAATMVTRKRRYPIKDASLEPKQTEAVERLDENASNEAEQTPVAKRPRRSRTKATNSNSSYAELDPIEEPAETSVKRRGRKRKMTTETVIEDTTDAAVPINTSTPDAMVTSAPATLIPATPADTITPRKRGRKPKYFQLLNFPKEATTVENAESATKWPQTPDFNLRLLLIRKREQLTNDEQLQENGKGTGSEQCGLCLVRCEPKNWLAHLKEHYGVGWTIDKPPTLLTRGILINMMTSFVKLNKRLSCRLCGKSFGSGLGILLHLEGCGDEPERVECEACKKKYSKLFFAQHYRSCSKRFQPIESSVTEEAANEEANSTPVYSKAGRAKRKSTIKAETKLQKIAEQLKKPTDEPITKDFEADSSDYDMGADKESSEEYESEGVDSNEEEDADQSRDEARSSAGENYSVRKDRTIKKRRKRPKTSGANAAGTNLSADSRILKPGDETSERWKYFVQTNYAQHMLYPELLPLYEQLLPSDAIKLLPSKDCNSMHYAYDREDEIGWLQLPPLGSFNQRNEHVCHLGRPVKELAWVPLPADIESQYLLCSQRAKMLGFTRQCKDTQQDDLLLLLECTTDGEQHHWGLQTRLHYGIQVAKGPVNTFAFMPSGGYDKSANRLALLAVGTAASVVIYALPLELSNCEAGETVIALTAAMTLSLEVDDPVRDPCTKICWSQAAGHKLLVTGYASGNVAFFDIADVEGLNCFERQNHRHFLPSSYFYFGERNIQTLELHYDANGARWLAVGATVRKFWVYDIANWSQPLPILGDVIHNLFLGCISWSPLWESLVIGCTEMSRSQFMRVISMNPVDLSFPPVTMDVMLSSIRLMHFNCDQNVLVSIADNGDVNLLSVNEFDSQTIMRRRTECGPIGVTEVCYLSDAPEPKYITPEVFQRDYGLIIRPLRFEKRKVRRAGYENPKRLPSFNQRTMMRLNCVRWNWNAPASSWLAVGAEHGLLRIINYKPDTYC